MKEKAGLSHLNFRRISIVLNGTFIYTYIKDSIMYKRNVQIVLIPIVIILSANQLLAIDYDPIQKEGDKVSYKNILFNTIVIGNLIDNTESKPNIVFATTDKRLFVLDMNSMSTQFSVNTTDVVKGIKVEDLNKDGINEVLYWITNRVFIYNNKLDYSNHKEFDMNIKAIVCIDANSDDKKDIVIALEKKIVAIDSLGKPIWETDLSYVPTNLLVSDISDSGKENLIISSKNKVDIYSHAGGLIEEINFNDEVVNKIGILNNNEDKIIIITSNYNFNEERIYKINRRLQRALVYISKEKIAGFSPAITRADSNFNDFIVFWSYFGTAIAINLSDYTLTKENLWTLSLKDKYIDNIEVVDLDNKEVPGVYPVNNREVILSTKDGIVYIYSLNPASKYPEIRRTYKTDAIYIFFSRIVSNNYPKILLQISKDGEFQKYWPFFKEYLFLNQEYPSAIENFNEGVFRRSKFTLESCINDEEMSKYYGLYDDCLSRINTIQELTQDCLTENLQKLRNGRQYFNNKNYSVAIELLFDVYKSYFNIGLIDSDLLDEEYTLENLREDILFSDLKLLETSLDGTHNIIDELDLLIQIYPSLDFMGVYNLQALIYQYDRFQEFNALKINYINIRSRIEEIISLLENDAKASVDKKDYNSASVKYGKILEAIRIIYGEDNENYVSYQTKLNEINNKILNNDRNKFILYSFLFMVVMFGVLIIYIKNKKGDITFILQKVGKNTLNEIFSIINMNNGKKESRNELNIEKKPHDSTDEFEFDIAISFAGEDRTIARDMAEKLKSKGIKVFYDEFYKVALWGKKLTKYFQKTYGPKARFVLVLISEHYPVKDWTDFESSIIRGEAEKRQTEFILPVRLDSTKIFGIHEDIAYLDLNTEGIDGIVAAIIEKVNETKNST